MDERDEIFELRLAKAQRQRDRGLDPYPPRFHRSHLSSQVVAEFRDEDPPLRVTVAGRLGVPRDLGKMAFVHLQDGTGRIQLQLRRDVLGDEQYSLLDTLDYGDFVGVSGEVFRTRRGEVSVKADSLTPLAKALRNPPDKWHGLTDVEKRYRQRYLDLSSNPETVEVFRARSRLIHNLRRRLVELDFMEVETPVLQAVPGGGAARPFETYYNALDQAEYLRIALELHLKRCVIGGLERVFEIGRIFRNEGLSAKHNPEFTMMELYQAYADYHDIMSLVEELVAGLARDVRGTPALPWGDQVIDFTPPWPRISLRDAILERSQVDIERYPDAESLRASAQCAGLRNVDPTWNRAKLIDELLSQFVEPKLIQPTFLIDYPLELSPLAKQRPGSARSGRAVRGLRWRHGDRERLHRAQRSARPACPLRGAGPRSRRWRRRGPAFRRRVPRGARVRNAADRRARPRHRPRHDAFHRSAHHPRRDPLPAAPQSTPSRAADGVDQCSTSTSFGTTPRWCVSPRSTVATPLPVDLLLEVDSRRREIIQAEEALRERRNQLGRQLADPRQRTPELIDEGRKLGDQVKTLSAERAALDTELDALLLQVPNLPDPSVPVGADESGNVELRRHGQAAGVRLRAEAALGIGRAARDHRF